MTAKIADAFMGRHKALRSKQDPRWIGLIAESARVLEMAGKTGSAAELWNDLDGSLPRSDITGRVEALNEKARILRGCDAASAEEAAREVVKLYSEHGGSKVVPDGANYEVCVRTALEKGDASMAFTSAWDGVGVHKNREILYEVLLAAAGDDVSPAKYAPKGFTMDRLASRAVMSFPGMAMGWIHVAAALNRRGMYKTSVCS